MRIGILTKLKMHNISESSIVTLIPAAGIVKSACNYNLSNEDPSFLNIGTLLAIDEIKKKTDLKVFLAVRKSNNVIFSLNPYRDINIISVGGTKTITETIENALKMIKADWVLINPITSIPSANNFSNSFIEFGEKKLPKENWSSITLKKNGQPLFHRKCDMESEGILSYPFTGRIFAKKKAIIKAINKLNNYDKNDLLNLAKELYYERKVEIKYTIWLDIGHVSTYPITRISSISSRFFNVLTFNEKENLIKKKSEKKSKISDEIQYYKSIPLELKRYFPAILNVEENENYISYEMEYIGKPNLSEIYLYGKLGPNAILRIFNSLEIIFKIFYEKNPLIKDNVDFLYNLKTTSRQLQLEQIIQKKEFRFLKEIYNNDFTLNNFVFPSLKKSFELLKIELLKFDRKRKLYLGHGDLCFNNILVDPVFGTIDLIDPKAEKNEKLNKYGLVDDVYDLSKLNHSIEGLYDSVVNNLFKLSLVDINNINFQIYKPEEYLIYNNYFKEIMLEKRIDSEYLRLLTANLFLTMLPMHVDNVERVISFALIGSIFISKYSMSNIIL